MRSRPADRSHLPVAEQVSVPVAELLLQVALDEVHNGKGVELCRLGETPSKLLPSLSSVHSCSPGLGVAPCR
ncbi:hypothetical protein GCM10023235_12740 [Kitasatospora terrestris]|uniref:Uncharacterized protein n=1 Tax=Kitasatospora terrestris TaxID=258051 RepID=A0ABP9DDA9_9ACTN